MANEITVSASLEFSKGGVTAELSKGGLQITVAGTKANKITQSIPTTEEALNVGEITAGGGWFMAINRDATNFVSIRRATGEGNMVKLLAGECCLFRMTATAPFAIADTAACLLEYVLIEA